MAALTPAVAVQRGGVHTAFRSLAHFQADRSKPGRRSYLCGRTTTGITQPRTACVQGHEASTRSTRSTPTTRTRSAQEFARATKATSLDGRIYVRPSKSRSESVREPADPSRFPPTREPHDSSVFESRERLAGPSRLARRPLGPVGRRRRGRGPRSSRSEPWGYRRRRRRAQPRMSGCMGGAFWLPGAVRYVPALVCSEDLRHGAGRAAARPCGRIRALG